MKLTIMMAVYNEEKFLSETLRSVLRQKDAAELDIIIVNDGSTDGTGQILQEFSDKNPEMRVIDIENVGVTCARNIALDHMRDDVDFVSFIDGDDLSPSGRFARDLRCFKEDDRLELVYGTLRLFEFSDPKTLLPTQDSGMADVRCISLSAGVYRASLIRKVGRFDEDFAQAEDMDFLMRLFELQPKYLVTDEIAVYYRRHVNNMTRDLTVLRREFSRALLKSTKRRRQMASFRMPDDVFDIKQVQEMYDWD